MAKSSAVASSPTPIVVAFYTTGDDRLSDGLPANTPTAAKLSNSVRYQKRAQYLASSGQAYGSATIEAATASLKAIRSSLVISKVYFVGHGFPGMSGGQLDPNGSSGFFFHGSTSTDPNVDFTGGPHEILVAPGGAATKDAHLYSDFLDELTKHASNTARLEIGFLSCYTATGTLLGWVSQTLTTKGFTNFLVGGFTHYYETRYTFDMKTGTFDPKNPWNDSITDPHNIDIITNQPTLISMGVNNQPPAYEVTKP